jgi:hypothetical protein
VHLLAVDQLLFHQAVDGPWHIPPGRAYCGGYAALGEFHGAVYGIIMGFEFTQVQTYPPGHRDSDIIVRGHAYYNGF